jgi:predicted nucleic acid-binding protein
MSSSSFLNNPQTNLIADASVVINLNATARAAEILKCLRNKFLVTDNACAELEEGGKSGHRDHAKLVELIDDGLIFRAQLGAKGAGIYESLIAGPTLQTLDDGEAATIAHAYECGGVALIDERKARTLCAALFPGLILASTIELLLHETVAAALGPQGQIDAVANALTLARMRVPAESVVRVRTMLGADRAALCSSLPKLARGVAD